MVKFLKEGPIPSLGQTGPYYFRSLGLLKVVKPESEDAEEGSSSNGERGPW